MNKELDLIKKKNKEKLELKILEIEKRYKIITNEFYKNLVNFSENKEKNIHNWFYYKEGYSYKLIENLLKDFGAKKGEILLDPFSGSGTTLVVGKEKGMKTIGFDVNPIATFISQVKTKNYSESEILELRKIYDSFSYATFKEVKEKEKPNLKIIDNLFFEEDLLKLLKLENYILEKYKNKEKILKLMKIAYIESLENISKVKKDGNGIKYKKNFLKIDIVNEFKKNLKKIIISLENNVNYFSKKNEESIIINDSFLNSKKYIGNRVDYVIFSPPYANCFDYCAVYKLELWMGRFVNSYADFKKLRGMAVRSHVNGSLKEDLEYNYEIVNWISEKLYEEKLWDKKIPKMLKYYFDDMTKVIKNLSEILVEGGKCAIVVGNSSYKGYVVPTDIILSMISEKFDFKVEKIEVARYLRTSSQQMKEYHYKKKYLRESIIFLKKNRSENDKKM